jgi:hypothetical protein
VPLCNFTCQAVETKLHRYIVDIRLDPIMTLLTPKNADTEDEATALAECISSQVSLMSWTKMQEGFELASKHAAELAEKEPC